MKKEEYIKENGRLERIISSRDSELEVQRQEMCRVLGFTTSSLNYGVNETCIKESTWAEIYAEVGRLRANMDFVVLTNRVSDFEYRIDRLVSEIKENKNE